MGDTPWQGDACSLVDAYRSGQRSPRDEMEATLAAIEASELNAFAYLDANGAMDAATRADVSAPFGGVPLAVKELEMVAGWPDTHASLPLAEQVAEQTSTHVERLVNAGAALVGLTTSSEFGAVNVTRTVLHGVTRNPWNPERTPGGSSGGAAAAVAGGLLPLATASDGGGSIRIPAGFCGLVGLKATYGRIPKSPGFRYSNLTSVVGCVSRSVRDTARWFDFTNGHDARDPLSLPRTGGWEGGLGSHADELTGLRVAVVDGWGGAVVSPATWEVVLETAELLIRAAGLSRVNGIDTTLPRMGRAWGLSGAIEMAATLGDRWPDCAEDLTPEVRFALRSADGNYSAAARAMIEECRTDVNEAMARIFDPADGVDLIIAASNPDVAFTAEGPLPDTFGGIEAGTGNNGRLTFPANLHGNAAISIPAGFVDGLPVGLQIVGRHFTEPLLLELAHVVEREQPWPLTTASVEGVS